MGRSRSQVLMDAAYAFSTLSTCSRTNVGAVIAIENRIISTGYNGVPSGMTHCDHTCMCPRGDAEYPAMHHSEGCPKVTPCQATVHAEANAIVFAARHGVATHGGTLYTTVSPCFECAKLIINAGIIRLVYGQRYRNTSGLDLLETSKVQIKELA